MSRSFVLSLLLLLISTALSAQMATITGVVKDEAGKPVKDVNVILNGTSIGTVTNEEGLYLIEAPINQKITLVFSFIGYQSVYKSVVLKTDKNFRFNPIMESDDKVLPEAVIVSEKERETFIQSIPVEELEFIPDPTGDPIISALRQMGAVSNNELSTQYSVRGGNYDENLVYVNDFEIYRPLLVRSGQQEGFGFANYNLTQSIAFSAGGFEAKYGDKLSSVLDIKYKRPKEFDASVSLSLLGGTFHLETANKAQTIGALIGVRHKNNSYLLNSLETEGEYNPSFTDIQGLVNFKVGGSSELEILGNLSQNRFRFVPENRSTSTGVVNSVIRLDVFFDGQEIDEFTTGMVGVSFRQSPNEDLSLKWMASGYRALESENFDIIGDYWLGAVESNLGDDNFGDVLFGLGVGTFQNYARNQIDSWVGNIGHKGVLDKGKHVYEWGARYQRERIEDRINEWERLDSAGYSIPFSDQDVLINEVLKTDLLLESNRYNAYFQDSWSPGAEDNGWKINGGFRLSYWDLNDEFFVSPRLQASFRPKDWKRKKDTVARNVVFKGALGIYNQPPFYRELRDLQGNVNTAVKSQKSVHFLLSSDWEFRGFSRDLRFVTELYFKYLYDLVPYEVENVRIRYFGNNAATGYAAGIDMRLHGELVKDADSWISLSLLKTEEDLTIDKYVDENGNEVDPGLIPRPTDQRLNFGMFFQDYMLNRENYKVHLNFLFGTGLPFGPPDDLRNRNAFRIPPYRRVDIGFSALLVDGEKKQEGFFGNFESIWASLEVFNLLGISNTISYIWVKDVNNVVYAFPNFLTSRRLNARVIIKL